MTQDHADKAMHDMDGILIDLAGYQRRGAQLDPAALEDMRDRLTRMYEIERSRAMEAA